MSTRHLIDPELLPGLDMIPQLQWTAEGLSAVRTQMAAMLAMMPLPETPGLIVEERTIPSPEGHQIGVVIYRPDAPDGLLPAVLHMHGGGYVIGSAKMTINSGSATARDAGCVVVSVDYRLAPDTPHPGPIEDCYAALQWLHANAAELGVDPARIAVAGESAGAGLAAALALLARDRGELPIVHQHLIYPMLDDRTCNGDANPNAGEFIWTRDSNRFGWASLLGREPGGEGVSPYAAAARAEDLTGLPPAFIAVGTLDLFAEEDLAYARRLMRAGVPTELHVYPGAYHGFDMMADAAIVQKAAHNSRTALRRALHPG